jgi:hypothetical protein
MTPTKTRQTDAPNQYLVSDSSARSVTSDPWGSIPLEALRAFRAVFEAQEQADGEFEATVLERLRAQDARVVPAQSVLGKLDEA